MSDDGVGRMNSRTGVRVGGMGGSNAGIVGLVVVAVPISGVVGSIAQVVGSVVGSVGWGTVGVGGCGDHSLAGSSAHVHLLSMTHAPLVLTSRSIARSIASSVSITSVTTIPIVTIAAIAISAIASPISSVATITAIAAVTSVASIASIAIVAPIPVHASL